ncbi:hypothetical protein N9Y89_02455 [bacterium]|nr:hypothetical protein [bacterium]
MAIDLSFSVRAMGLINSSEDKFFEKSKEYFLLKNTAEDVFTHFPFLKGDHPLLFVALGKLTRYSKKSW